MSVERVVACVVALGSCLLASLAGAQTRALDPPLKLELDDSFPVRGRPLNFTLTGPAGTVFKLMSSTVPKETHSPQWGAIFIDISNMVELAAGTLPESGQTAIQIEFAGEVGKLRYFQAAGQLGPQSGVSNSVVTRIEAAERSGARHPEAIAVSPDGAKAFVVHEDDAALSVLDVATDQVVHEFPLFPPPVDPGVLPTRLAVDPEGRHLLAMDPRSPFVVLVDVASDSVAGVVSVPLTTRDVAFDFTGPTKRAYFTNERDQAILVFEERPAGTFRRVDTIPLQGQGPGRILRTDEGLLLVLHRESHELEFVDPSVPGGLTVHRLPLGRVAWDMAFEGQRLFIPTFTRAADTSEGDGVNVLLQVDLATREIVRDSLLANLGTDYRAIAIAGQTLAVAGSGSGALILGDLVTGEGLDRIELAPGEPVAHPLALAFVPIPGGGAPAKLYVVDYFRETVRPVDLTVGPPFALGAEIALAHIGRPRVPGVDLSALEDGAWLFSSVAFFNGTFQTPNPSTCATCHPFRLSSGLNHPDHPVDGRQAPPIFDVGATGPWLSGGGQPDLMALTQTQFNVHGVVGGTLDPANQQKLVDWEVLATPVPRSPSLGSGGGLDDAQRRGKGLFEGVAGCSTCHAAPLFIPVPPAPLTIDEGVGTGLAPANVPSLRGLWSSAPYLWNGQAPALLDVLTTANPSDQHGTTSTLTPEELADLVEFLKTL